MTTPSPAVDVEVGTTLAACAGNSCRVFYILNWPSRR